MNKSVRQIVLGMAALSLVSTFVNAADDPAAGAPAADVSGAGTPAASPGSTEQPNSAVGGNVGSGVAGGAHEQLMGPPNVDTNAAPNTPGDFPPENTPSENTMGSPSPGGYTSGANAGGSTGSGAVTTQQPNPNDPTLGTGVAGEPGNPPGTDMAAQFERLDGNKDGNISRSEAKKDKAIIRKFEQADKNKDGKLSDSEFRGIESAARNE